MKTKLFVDFDGTLFDRDAFKKRLISVINKQGFSSEEIEEGYKAVHKNSGYEGVWAHLNYLDKNIRSIDLKKAESEIAELFENAKKLLFPDAIELLSKIDRDKYEVDLITVGGIRFQKAKVAACNIEKFFDNCYYTTGEKADFLEKLISNEENFFLLEDKDSTIKSVRERFPKARVFKAEKTNLLDILKLVV